VGHHDQLHRHRADADHESRCRRARQQARYHRHRLFADPAVMLYNKFSRDIGRFSGRLQSFESEFAMVLSRQLDMKG
jgi:TnpA family transposase